ncbi:uncharacterized protein LOC120712507 isoform X1 [Panicum virgatum]|uniref:Uncharacterized protein n=1 Tax=Panicum virgatum TaxID=38727 RepID=A0A8T0RHS0_PANVG|nr:uncharacterized protein LOC120712507 isoform X1 [Panicum virgatum]KAG2584229.1 hypothetical protein PVAP13_6KG288200 [Panicum virgatum]
METNLNRSSFPERCNRNCSGAFVLWRSARRGAAERSHARPWHGAEGSELLCAKPAASSGEGGGDRRAAGIGVGVSGGAAAALAAGLDAAKEDGVAALLWLKAIMEATDVGGPAEILDLDGLVLHIKNRLVALSGRVQKVKDELEHLPTMIWICLRYI